MRNASSTTDGRQIFMPSTYYPWGVFYRPSLFEERGYTEPRTFDESAWARTSGCSPTARPDGLLGQGRLGADGHLRHAEPAHQRLRVPPVAARRTGGLGRGGEEGVRGVEADAALHAGGVPSAAPGRRPHRACPRRSPARSCSECSPPAAVRHLPGGSRRYTDPFCVHGDFHPAIGAGVVEAPIDGFHDGRGSPQPAGREGPDALPQHPGGRRHHRQGRPGA